MPPGYLYQYDSLPFDRGGDGYAASSLATQEYSNDREGFWDELQFSTPSTASAPQIDDSLLQYRLPTMTNHQSISSRLPAVGTSVTSQRVGDLQALFNSLVPTAVDRPGEVVTGQRFGVIRVRCAIGIVLSV